MSVTRRARLDAEPMLSKAGRFLDPRLHPCFGFWREHSFTKTLVAGADLPLGDDESLCLGLFALSCGLLGSPGEADNGAGLDRAVLQCLDPISIGMALERGFDRLLEDGAVGVVVL